MSKLESIKEFLDSIPQFVRDLELDDPYLAVPHYKNFYRYLQDYKVTELPGAGFEVSAYRAPDTTDLILYPLWHTYAAKLGSNDFQMIYEGFLQEYPVFKAEFSLEEFCNTFSDFYLEFLNDAGFNEDDVEVAGNQILVKGALDASAPTSTVQPVEQVSTVEEFGDAEEEPVDETQSIEEAVDEAAESDVE